MKPLLAWLALALAAFAALAAFTHADRSAHPERIVVAVDTSYEMSKSAGGLDKALAALGSRYAEYLIVDSMTVLRGWGPGPGLAAKPSFFGEADYAALRAAGERAAAREGATRLVYLVPLSVPPELAGKETIAVR